jgi:hypothetical protein
MTQRAVGRTVTVSAKALQARSTTKSPTRTTMSASAPVENSEMRDILALAEAKGLLSGARTLVVRGRMPVELVAQAKRRTGITSDSKLLEAALASVALSDDYAEWLLAHRGTVSPELDLEF